MTFPLMPVASPIDRPFYVNPTPLLADNSVAAGASRTLNFTIKQSRHRYIAIMQLQSAGSGTGNIAHATVTSGNGTLVYQYATFNTGGDDYQAATMAIWKVPEGDTVTVRNNDAAGVGMFVLEIQGWKMAAAPVSIVGISTNSAGTLTGLSGDAFILYCSKIYFSNPDLNSGNFDVWVSVANIHMGFTSHHSGSTFAITDSNQQGVLIAAGFNL